MSSTESAHGYFSVLMDLHYLLLLTYRRRQAKGIHSLIKKLQMLLGVQFLAMTPEKRCYQVSN